jgi:hypothetical protein
VGSEQWRRRIVRHRTTVIPAIVALVALVAFAATACTTSSQAQDAERSLSLSAGCNMAALTFPPGTDPATVADNVSPSDALDTIWRLDNATGSFQAFATAAPEASDLQSVNLLDAVFLCVDAPADISMPTVSPDPSGASSFASLSARCNAVGLTFPDGTTPSQVAGAISPSSAFASMWRLDNATGLFQAYSAAAPEVSDLTSVQFLDAVFLCTTAPASISMPALPGMPTGAPPPPPSSGEAGLMRDFTLPLPLFAPDSAWNQTATDAAVLPDSDQQILVLYRVLRGDTTDLFPPGPPSTTWPFMDVGYDDYSTPIFPAGTGQQSVLICDYEGNMWYVSPKWSVDQLGGPVSVPAPAGTVRPSGPQDTQSDGLLVIYDADTFTEYDFWQATTVRDGECSSRGGGLEGTTIFEAGFAEFFDVRGPGSNLDTFSSASASGVPLLAGLIVPEDIERGAIQHALAFAVPGMRNLSADRFEPLASNYMYPASTTESDFINTNPNALAGGQRIRLKQSIVDDSGNPIDESEAAPITRMYLEALRTYGAYLRDNAGGFSFYAEDYHTANLRLSDDEVNALIGEPPGTPLPAGKTKWQIVLEKLNEQLEFIPIAYGPWTEGQDPATATIGVSNFEVVEPATLPASAAP